MSQNKISGAEIIVKVLIEQGCDVIFGYPGGQVLNIYESLYHHKKEIKHILTAHEQGAAHAADGYARSSGKTGVVLATSGPGATNLVTGIAAAYMDSIPVVAITGNVPTSQIGTDSFQEVDITGITMPVTKHNFFVDKVEKLADTLRKAFVLAKSGRPGPVLVDIPKDVQEKKCVFIPCEKVSKEEPFAAKEIRIEEAANVINNAKRPFIYFGGGVVSADADKELTELSELIDAPMGCSMMGLSCISGNFKKFLGMQGMHGNYACTMAMNKADVIIACGVRFNDRSTNDRRKFELNAKVVHIDVDGSELSKTVDEYCSLRGDLKETLKLLLKKLDKKNNDAWSKQIEKFKKDGENKNLGKNVFNPEGIYHLINELKKDMPVVTDVGQHQVWAAQYLSFTKKRSFISNCGLGAMGYGLGAAIGTAFGRDMKERVLLITGDGSFGMNLNELATAVTYNIPVTVIIMDNNVLGMVRQYQTMYYKKHYSATVLNRKTDFVALAKAFGADGRKVSDLESLREAFELSIESKGPFVIDCMMDKDELVLPMMKPGGSTEDIITEWP